VKEGTVPVELGKFYSRIFDHRLESDYGDDAELKEGDLRADLEKAQEFIAHIESQLGSI
jgi:uncharacterized protein (UPF0332 family)